MIFDLFSDIFTYRNNVLTRADVRVKLITAAAALLAVIASTKPALPLCVLALCVIAMLALKIPARLVLLRLAGPAMIVLFLAVVKSLTVGSSPIGSLFVGSRELVFRLEGLRDGALIASRTMGAVSVTLLLGFVTPANRMFQATYAVRPLRGWLEVAQLTYRYIFVLLDRVSDLGAAQRLRLGYSSARRTFTSAGTLAGATLVHSLDQAARTHESMRLRGYTGSMPFSSLGPMRKSDWRALACLLVLLLVAFCAQEWGAAL